VQAAAVEHLHGHLEAFAFRAQPVPGRDADIVEDDVVDVGALLTHLLLGLTDRHAGKIARDEESGNAASARRTRFSSSGKQRNDVPSGETQPRRRGLTKSRSWP
jgi:hypothetical protein